MKKEEIEKKPIKQRKNYKKLDIRKYCKAKILFSVEFCQQDIKSMCVRLGPAKLNCESSVGIN